MYVLALLHACNGKSTCTYAMKWGIFYNETKSKQLLKVHKSVGIGRTTRILNYELWILNDKNSELWISFAELRLHSLRNLKLLWETKVSVVATDAFIPRRRLHEPYEFWTTRILNFELWIMNDKNYDLWILNSELQKWICRFCFFSLMKKFFHYSDNFFSSLWKCLKKWYICGDLANANRFMNFCNLKWPLDVKNFEFWIMNSELNPPNSKLFLSHEGHG